VATSSACTTSRFELRDWAHVQRACDQLGRKGRPDHLGPGRHGIGHNIFIYHFDPDHRVVEYYTELDQMKDEAGGYFEPRPWHKDHPQRPKVWTDFKAARLTWGPLRHPNTLPRIASISRPLRRCRMPQRGWVPDVSATPNQRGTRMIEFYFDFHSPYSYLAYQRLPELAACYGYTIACHVADLATLKRLAGNTAPRWSRYR